MTGQAQVKIYAPGTWDGDPDLGQGLIACITNGRVSCAVNEVGVMSFYRDGKLFLREYFRSYGGTISRESRCLKVVNREWKGCIGGDQFSLNLKFESNNGEKLFGMGQYQQEYLDLKGTVL